MLSDYLRVLYLHGFASGPQSQKARFFAEKFRALGIAFEAPDLAAGDFEHLTITAQLAIVEKLLDTPPAPETRTVLFGSSLGGYLAALTAARRSDVDRLVLFAPAFGFRQLWADHLGPEKLAQWRTSGSLSVFHYSEGREQLIGYQFFEDAKRYEDFPAFSQPALVFHGNGDSVVPVQYSAEFAQLHKNVSLIELPSGHELMDVLDVIWQQTAKFLLPYACNENV